MSTFLLLLPTELQCSPLREQSRIPGDRCSNWDGSRMTNAFLDAARCNFCFAQTNGRAKLARVLLTWYKWCIQVQMWQLSFSLTIGWEHLFEGMKDQGLPKNYIREVRALFTHTKLLRISNWNGKPILGYEEVTTIKLRHAQLKDILDRARASGDTDREIEYRHETLVQNFTNAEVRWMCLMRWQGEVEENPNLLVEWALGRDGSSLF